MKIDGYDVYVYYTIDRQSRTYNSCLYLSKDGINFIHLLFRSNDDIIPFRKSITPAWNKAYAKRNQANYELYDSKRHKIHIVDTHTLNYLNELLKSEFYVEILNED